MTARRRTRSTGVDHVGVFVSSLAKSRAWHVRVLGLRFVEEDEDRYAKIVTLRGRGVEVHLFRMKRKAPPEIHHVAIRVPRLDRELARLRRDRVDVSGPHRYKNARFIKFRDPDGVTWEFISRAP